MADVYDCDQRSRVMASIRSKHTKPELSVRKIVWRLGFRYRLHVKTLPGSPDLVFPGRRKVIFVHGCFWHRHPCKKGLSVPATNTDMWRSKFRRNRERDRRNRDAIRRLGWTYLVLWECQIRHEEWLAQQ